MYHSPASIIHTEVAIGCHPPTGTIWVRPRAARPAAPHLFALTSLPPPRVCLLAPNSYGLQNSDGVIYVTAYTTECNSINDRQASHRRATAAEAILLLPETCSRHRSPVRFSAESVSRILSLFWHIIICSYN